MKIRTLAAVGVAVGLAAQSQAQEPMDHAKQDAMSRSPVAAMLGARAIVVGTVQSPAYASRTFREGYVTQPIMMEMLSAYGGRLALDGMLDFEGLTLERGELEPGMEGEGYVDRRASAHLPARACREHHRLLGARAGTSSQRG